MYHPSVLAVSVPPPRWRLGCDPFGQRVGVDVFWLGDCFGNFHLVLLSEHLFPEPDCHLRVAVVGDFQLASVNVLAVLYALDARAANSSASDSASEYGSCGHRFPQSQHHPERRFLPQQCHAWTLSSFPISVPPLRWRLGCDPFGQRVGVDVFGLGDCFGNFHLVLLSEHLFPEPDCHLRVAVVGDFQLASGPA
jgi:hypothetical protein